MREETAALLADVAHNLRHVLGTWHTHWPVYIYLELNQTLKNTTWGS